MLLCSGTTLTLMRLTDGIPALFAGYYWSSHTVLFRVIVPISCVLAFIAHPVGAQAWVYTLYWWLPVIFYLLPINTLFITALGSTLIAHAVGSVIWIYGNPSNVHLWHTLLPIVAIERLFFALSMVVFYRLWQKVSATLSVPFFSWIHKTA